MANLGSLTAPAAASLGRDFTRALQRIEEYQGLPGPDLESGHGIGPTPHPNSNHLVLLICGTTTAHDHDIATTLPAHAVVAIHGLKVSLHYR
jgi:hypothetical protein